MVKVSSWVMLIALVVALTACADTTTQGGQATPTQAAVVAATPTKATITTSSSVTESNTMTSTTAMATGAMVMLHKDPTLGEILVDNKGMTLYTYDKDTADKGTCTGDCLKNWPALTANSANEKITAGEGVTGTLSVITRDDGTFQIAVNHMPLYTYAKDTKGGEANGQGVGEVWWVVGPDGNKITKK